jgi:hypothetical protein
MSATTVGKRYGSTCPVCDAAAFTLLAPVWRNYHQPRNLTQDALRWFAECDRRGTVVMLPLHDDFDAGGTLYYNQDETEAHVRQHFESYQRPNYDHVREFLRRTHAPAEYRRWLDVGSVGYPTTFDDYEFTTIEPDARAARAGEALFRTGRVHGSTLDAWHPADRYDGLLFNNSFYCLTDPGAALEKAGRLLRPGGRLVITLSSTFADAVSDREDGRVLMIEDLIFGETLQVYYNRFSLTYLAERHGFRLVDVALVPAYGCKTMNAHVFELTGTPRSTPGLLERSRDQMSRVWRETFAGFAASIRETLSQINAADVVLAGSLTVIRDLARYGDLSAIKGILPVPDPHLAGSTLDGLRVVDSADLAREDTDDYRVIVCAFRDSAAVVAELKLRLGDDVRLFVPTRRSGMEFIDFSFKDGIYPSKGFVVREHARGEHRVRLRGKRTVVYGAGAGGREAAERIAAAGGRVVAVCDSNVARHGEPFESHRIVPFTSIPSGDFDVVVVASRPGFAAIAAGLERAGLVRARDFVALDEVR